jgi:hypothetical protein
MRRAVGRDITVGWRPLDSQAPRSAETVTGGYHLPAQRASGAEPLQPQRTARPMCQSAPRGRGCDQYRQRGASRLINARDLANHGPAVHLGHHDVDASKAIAHGSCSPLAHLRKGTYAHPGRPRPRCAVSPRPSSRPTRVGKLMVLRSRGRLSPRTLGSRATAARVVRIFPRPRPPPRVRGRSMSRREGAVLLLVRDCDSECRVRCRWPGRSRAKSVGRWHLPCTTSGQPGIRYCTDCSAKKTTDRVLPVPTEHRTSRCRGV